jgi:hypothetical protein
MNFQDKSTNQLAVGSSSWQRIGLKLTTAVFILILSLISAFVNDTYGETKFAGEFMNFGLGARPLGMGSAYVAIADDATALYWNPAGGVQLEGKELFLMHSESFESVVKFDGISYLQSAGSRSSIGVLFTRLGVDGIPITDSIASDPNFPFDITDRVGAQDLLLTLSYAQMQGDRFSWGGSVKLISRDTGTNSALGTGVDLGGLYRPGENIAIGVNLQDATTTITTWDTGQKDFVLPTLKTGIVLKRDIDFPKGDLLFALDLDLKFENRGKEASQITFGRGSGDIHLGAEYLFRNTLAFRTGTDIGRFTMGAGLRHKSFKFDYAFFDHEGLGDSYRISGSLIF